MIKSNLYKILCLLTIVTITSACGIKPAELDAPNPENTSFPSTYPKHESK